MTRLPIDMTSTERFSPEDPAPSRTYVFDYPKSGPADIYAAGCAARRGRRRPPAVRDP